MAKEPKRRGRPRVLSHERILDAAEKIPFETLSVLKLSKKLRVSDPAIYYYFPSRDALCRALVERWTTQFNLPSPRVKWRTFMRALAEETFRLLSQRPGAADFMMYAGPSGPNQLHILDAGLETLLRAGFSPVMAIKIYTSVINTAIDAARQLDSDARLQAATGKSVRSATQSTADQSGKVFPSYTIVRDALEAAPEPDKDAQFNFTISTILKGLPEPA